MTTIAAFLHGYPPVWAMGGEVSTHRTLRHVPGSIVFTNVDKRYTLDGVDVRPLKGLTASGIREQAESVNADILFTHSTMSSESVRAARRAGLPTLLAVHAPPRFAADLRRAWSASSVKLYNTEESRRLWGDNRGWVLHPPIGQPGELPAGSRDAITITSSLLNKGVNHVLALARVWPKRRFIIVESPAHGTHGDPAFWDIAGAIPNIEIWPRLHPDEMGALWAETRVLLVPSRYETYGMSAIEAAWHGIPSVHVDTPHVREGIGPGAVLLKTPTTKRVAEGVKEIEHNYGQWSDRARRQAEKLGERERIELDRFAENVATFRRHL